MEESKNNCFSLMVVGDAPNDLLKKYDSSIEVEPYIKYYYKDAGKLRKKYIETIESLINKSPFNDITIDYLKEKMKHLKDMTDFEYYATITQGLDYDNDGNALSTKNPNGKFKHCSIGKTMCIPLTLKDGTESYQAYSRNVNWTSMQLNKCDLYKSTWELFKGLREPKNEQEEKIYNNIKYQQKYFQGFKDVDEYINYNCSYWNYAYLDKDGWIDSEDYKHYDWITDYYKRFVIPLQDDDLITIYECVK